MILLKKNLKNIPNVLDSMIQKSVSLFEESDFKPESCHKSKTTASSLKLEVDNLLDKLRDTVSITFCVKDWNRLE